MREIFGHGGGEPLYVPPVLLTGLGRVQGDLQFRYICDSLRELKADGKLFATDLLAQRAFARDAVGLALTGQTIDPESRTHVRSAEPIPDEILTHKILVRCVKGTAEAPGPKTIRYKRAVVKDPHGRVIGPRLGVSSDGATYRSAMVRNVDKWVDWDASEVAMSLPEAWICLSQHGRFCRPAKSERLQRRYWLYEEANHPAVIGAAKATKVK